MAKRVGQELIEHQAVDIVAGPDSYRDMPMLLDRAISDSKVLILNRVKLKPTQVSFLKELQTILLAVL